MKATTIPRSEVSCTAVVAFATALWRTPEWFKVSARWKLPDPGRTFTRNFEALQKTAYTSVVTVVRNTTILAGWGFFYVTNSRVVIVPARKCGNTGEIRPPDVDALFGWGWLPGMPPCCGSYRQMTCVVYEGRGYVPNLNSYTLFWPDTFPSSFKFALPT